MPYYVLPQSVRDRLVEVHGENVSADMLNAVTALDSDQFESRGDAYSEMKRRNEDGETADDPSVVHFRASHIEVLNWRGREDGRFKSGVYTRVPWYEDDSYPEHKVHLSVKTPGLIAYTPDDEYGIADRQVRTKPGKYLTQFYGGDCPHFDAKTIARYVAECSAQNQTLKITRDEDEIARVYANGPGSCMSGRHDFGHLPCHPTAVYADPSDLALAYFGPIDHASQRAIVWPERTVYVRIYGTGPLETLLHDRGYHEVSSFRGAKIRAIAHAGGYVLPYIDGSDSVGLSRDRKFFIIGEYGYSADETSGHVYHSSDDDRNEDEDDDPQTQCRNCRDWFSEDDSEGYGDDLCQDCYDAQWRCEECDRESFDTDSHDRDYRRICDRCYEDGKTECADESCSEKWYEDEEFTEDETADRKRRDVLDLCKDCADRYVFCEHCETSYDEDETRDRIGGDFDRSDPAVTKWIKPIYLSSPFCPTCGRSPRCEETADLLSPCLTPGIDETPIVVSSTSSTSDTIMEAIAAADLSSQDDRDREFWKHNGVLSSDGHPAGRYRLEIFENGPIPHWSTCYFRQTGRDRQQFAESVFPEQLHDLRDELTSLHPSYAYRIVSILQNGCYGPVVWSSSDVSSSVDLSSVSSSSVSVTEDSASV